LRPQNPALNRAALGGVVVLCSLVAGCSDDEDDGNKRDPSPLDSGLDASGPYDPYWTDFDSSVDLVPDAEAPAKQHVWADWTAFSAGDQGSAQAVFNINVDGGLSLTYRGELYNAQVDGGLPYWTPSTPYVSVAVPNAPAASDNIMLAGGMGSVHTLTFSAPVTNPVVAVMSMGSNDTTTVCRFDNDFDLLSSAPGYYGEGQPLKHLPDNTLSGRESSGAIRFNGTFTTIRWTAVISEPWYGLTVGVPAP
jgi:hypothetical protein